MNKFDRVVTILMLLQTKRIVKAQDLADKFEVSIRTIYRDLRTLENAGVPISAEAGIGYSLVEGYNLPPVMFTKEEATSFLVAEKLMEKMTDKDISKQFSEAIYKIKAVLRESEKETLDNLEDHIQVTPRISQLNTSSEKRMPLIFESISQKNIVEIDYKAIYNGKNTKRKIEPLGVHFYSNAWHLIAFCQLRMDYRDFRIDRINHLKLTDSIFEKKHPNLKDYLHEIASKQDLIEVRIAFDETAASYARTEKYYYGFVNEIKEGNTIVMLFLTPSLYGMAHWLLGFVDKIDIKKPIELKDRMIDLTKKLVQKYTI